MIIESLPSTASSSSLISPTAVTMDDDMQVTKDKSKVMNQRVTDGEAAVGHSMVIQWKD